VKLVTAENAERYEESEELLRSAFGAEVDENAAKKKSMII
jgi:hypothetical protein